MKVALDIRNLNPGHLNRGIGVYTKQLFKHLQELEDDDFSVELVEKGQLPEDTDLVHYPWFDLFWPSLKIDHHLPSLVTIHDVIPLRFPQHFPAGIKGKLNLFRQKSALKKVNQIITDSHASKKDIVKFLKIPEEKINVIYLAAADQFHPLKNTTILQSMIVKYKLPQKFILYVGDVNWNKNIKGLIEAFDKLKAQSSKLKATAQSLKLILVGKAFLDNNLKETLKINNLIKKYDLEKDIIKLGFVPTNDLVAIYNLATVYCQPSFWEGFGLPVLEAMTCGTPVIASNLGSLPEVVGDAAILINPQDVDEIANGILQALASTDYQKKSLDQARKFNWLKTAQNTLGIYRKVLSPYGMIFKNNF